MGMISRMSFLGFILTSERRSLEEDYHVSSSSSAMMIGLDAFEMNMKRQGLTIKWAPLTQNEAASNKKGKVGRNTIW